MVLKELILLALLSLAPYHKDTETWEERATRMEFYAESIDTLTKEAVCLGEPTGCVPKWLGNRRDLAFALVILGNEESHYARHIHDAQCDLAKRECDAVHVTVDGIQMRVPQSFSPWQIKKFDVIQVDWDIITSGGNHASYLALEVAILRFSRAHRRCQLSIEGAFSGYARGGLCNWPGAKGRVADWEKLRNMSVEELQRKVTRRREKLTAQHLDH